MSERPLLLIPGPIEVSPTVLAATSVAPPSHVAPHVIEHFGAALEMMRSVWLADADAMPFAVGGGGTLAMESVATNLVDPGETVLVVNSGYFGDRMADMLTRRGAQVEQVVCEPGDAPSADAVDAKLASMGSCKAVFATHVDTSTGVRVDVQGIAAAATRHGALSIFDGVCATAGERFEMANWGADVYLTASQKAIGLPAGLGLWVASARAMEARRNLKTAPTLTLDWNAWTPIMTAYMERRGSYFSTPPTTLTEALHAGLSEILQGADAAQSMGYRFHQHQQAADAMRAAWSALELELLPSSPDIAANTLSAIRYPDGIDATVLPRIKEHGAIVAGGLHPKLKTTYFRVGHMGYTATQPEMLLRGVKAVAQGLSDAGWHAAPAKALGAARDVLGV